MGRIFSRDIHQPIRKPIPPATTVASGKLSDVHCTMWSPQTKKHRLALKAANVSPTAMLAHRGVRELFKKTRQSIGTTVTATIKLDASAKVFVQASGEKSR